MFFTLMKFNLMKIWLKLPEDLSLQLNLIQDGEKL